MKSRSGLSMGINVVILAAMGLVILAVSGIMIQTGSADISDTSQEGATDAQCDTWAEGSLTAGDTENADEWEREYNENCEGTLDEKVNEEDRFIGSDYDTGDHEDDAFFEDYEPDSGEEPPNVGGSAGAAGIAGALAGGEDYPDEKKISASQADYTARSASELDDALSQASNGEIVFIPGDARIEVSPRTFYVPSGVILASNRGLDGSKGGLIDQTRAEGGNGLISLESNSRVTGLRIDGPKWEWMAGSEGNPPHSRDDVGLTAYSDNIEIDNNDITGYGHSAIATSGSDVHIHHNNISHNPRGGLGYGIVSSGGFALIEGNYFNYNRHSIAGTGSGGYEAAYNLFGPDHVSHVLDQHQPGGTMTNIHHNTVEADEYHLSHNSMEHSPHGVSAVTIRGVPSEQATINNNWFYQDMEPCASHNWPSCAIKQQGVSSFQNVDYNNNHLGESEPPSCDIGAGVREGCLDETADGSGNNSTDSESGNASTGGSSSSDSFQN